MRRITTTLIITATLAGPMLALPIPASAQVSVGLSVNVGPPPLPYYPQPFAPASGYLWTPGYWLYGPYGYYWVPGTWVLAPVVGYLWTPGYWGWRQGFYWWHPGYWGPHVGYYGGIYYGYGYTGQGYRGGYWRGNVFYYNRAVSNVNVTYFHNTYNQPVSNEIHVSRVSYHGGEGGVMLEPTQEQNSFKHEQQMPATDAQMNQERIAVNKPTQRFSSNNGQPNIAATTLPGEFKGSGVVHMNKTQDTYVYHPNKHNTSPKERNGYANEKYYVHGQLHTEPPTPKHPPPHEKHEPEHPPHRQ